MEKKTYRFEIRTNDKPGTILEKDYFDGAGIDREFFQACQQALMWDNEWYANDGELTIGHLACYSGPYNMMHSMCGLTAVHDTDPETGEKNYRLYICDLRYPFKNKERYKFWKLREGVLK